MRTILIVDDAAHVRAALRRLLAESGFVVQTARDGREALEFLARTALPDAIVLDLSMPVMGGCEFLERKALDPRIRLLPVFVLTSHKNPPVALRYVVGLFQKARDERAMLTAIDNLFAPAPPAT